MQPTLSELFNMIIENDIVAPGAIKSILLSVLKRLLYPMVLLKFAKKRKEADNYFAYFDICVLGEN